MRRARIQRLPGFARRFHHGAGGHAQAPADAGPVLAATLASSAAESPAGRARAAAALNLRPATVQAVVEQLSKPAGQADLCLPFVGVRRLSDTDADKAAIWR